MFASLVVILALSIVIFGILYALLVYILNRRTRSDLEMSYQDRGFAKRCLEQFAVCSDVIGTLADTIKESLKGEDSNCVNARRKPKKALI